MSHPSSPLRGAIERLSGYLDDLLAERRPRRFLAQSAEELRLLKAAARLRGARPGADRPDPAFLADLRRQLAAAEGGRRTAEGDGEATPSAVRPQISAGVTRRRLLARVGGLVAALVAGFGLGRLDRLTPPHGPPAAGEGGSAPGRLVGENGRWQRVAALDEVAPGQALRFSAGPLEGYLINTKGGLRALSAVCTHLGCLVRWQERERELECPCHGAAFDSAGRMKYGPASYREPLPPLPAIETRVDGGQVYVWTV
jgi:nitrite reductase/ring-hydroxylating ferredoxin subunit